MVSTCMLMRPVGLPALPAPMPPPAAVGCCLSVACLVPAKCLPLPALCPTCRHRTPTLSSAFSRAAPLPMRNDAVVSTCMQIELPTLRHCP